jgi:phosphopantothenoylcysteine decarboxylase/phosphopantothenate--cysteine ligase
VLSGLAARRRAGQTLVGFAAEHGAHTLDYAREKLQRKGLDAVVANDVSRADSGFEAEHNEVFVLTRGQEIHLAHAPKAQIAEGILDVVEQLRGATGATVDADATPPRGQRLRAL